jgi:hypothetical protein
MCFLRDKIYQFVIHNYGELIGYTEAVGMNDLGMRLCPGSKIESWEEIMKVCRGEEDKGMYWTMSVGNGE